MSLKSRKPTPAGLLYDPSRLEAAPTGGCRVHLPPLSDIFRLYLIICRSGFQPRQHVAQIPKTYPRRPPLRSVAAGSRSYRRLQGSPCAIIRYLSSLSDTFRLYLISVGAASSRDNRSQHPLRGGSISPGAGGHDETRAHPTKPSVRQEFARAIFAGRGSIAHLDAEFTGDSLAEHVGMVHFLGAGGQGRECSRCDRLGGIRQVIPAGSEEFRVEPRGLVA